MMSGSGCESGEGEGSSKLGQDVRVGRERDPVNWVRICESGEGEGSSKVYSLQINWISPCPFPTPRPARLCPAV